MELQCHKETVKKPCERLMGGETEEVGAGAGRRLRGDKASVINHFIFLNHANVLPIQKVLEKLQPPLFKMKCVFFQIFGFCYPCSITSHRKTSLPNNQVP